MQFDLDRCQRSFTIFASNDSESKERCLQQTELLSFDYAAPCWYERQNSSHELIGLNPSSLHHMKQFIASICKGMKVIGNADYSASMCCVKQKSRTTISFRPGGGTRSGRALPLDPVERTSPY